MSKNYNFEINNLGAWEWNFKSGNVELSDEIFEITGLNKKDFDKTMESVLNILIHPDSKEDFKKSLDMFSKNYSLTTEIYRVINPRIEECWVQVSGKMIFNDKGEPIKIIGTFFDVTKEYISKKNLNSNLDFLESIFETLPNPIFYKDSKGIYKFCNEAFLKYIGKTKEEVINHGVYDIAPKELADIYFTADSELIKSKGFQIYETVVKYADGSLHDVIFNKATNLDSKGRVVGLVGIMQDITEKKKIEKEIQMLHKIKNIFLEVNKTIMNFKNNLEFFDRIQEKLQSVFDNCSQSTVLEVREDKTIFILTSVGYDKEEVPKFSMKLGESFLWKDVKGKFDKAQIVNDIYEYFPNEIKRVPKSILGQPIRSTLMIPLYIEGVLKWIISLDSIDNNVYSKLDQRVADYIREELPIIYNLHKFHQKTLYCSRYDGLTGIINRRYFDSLLLDKLKYAKKHNKKFFIVLFDIDGLKKINDKHGHFYGDIYLKGFVDFMNNNLKFENYFSRIGGDEFTCLFFDEELKLLKDKLEKLRLDFEKIEFGLDGNLFRGSFSYGMSVYPDDGYEKSPLLQLADRNMYKDKKNRRSKDYKNITK